MQAAPAIEVVPVEQGKQLVRIVWNPAGQTKATTTSGTVKEGRGGRVIGGRVIGGSVISGSGIGSWAVTICRTKRTRRRTIGVIDTDMK